MARENLKYHFEGFCFDTECGQLLKNGSPISLTSKALSVLLMLVEKHGKFVGKEEIIERVWPESFVEEANLTQQIYMIRKALGRDRDQQPLIETMPKRGYRLNASVSSTSDEGVKTFDEPHDQRATPDEASVKRVTVYEFDDFVLDPQRRLLYKRGEPITLASKVFDTLLYLVENAGRLVKKDDLMDKVWQERFVEENNLTQKIFILRQVLGENKKEHQFIVTVPGEGYMFVASVAKTSGEKTGSAQRPRRTAGTRKESLTTTFAVLPFKNLMAVSSGGPADFSGVGLADAIISQLSRYEELIVRPTVSVMEFRSDDWQPLKIARQMHVAYVVGGIIQHFGTKLKVSVNLFEAEIGGVIWAEDFTYNDVDVFQTQDEISNRVSKAIAAKLDLDPLPAQDHSPKNFDAFQEYIKGKFHWNVRTVEGLKKGIEHAQNALAIEPTYAMAYVGLADCYNLLAGQHSYMPPKDAFPKAKAASERALEISGGALAEAYASLAFTTFYFDWDRELSRRYFQQAIDLKPNYPTSHHWYGEALAAEGRFEESIAELRRAQELDPLSPAISADLAQTFLLAERLDESKSLLGHLLEINPRFVRGLYLSGILYQQLGNYDRAVEALRQAADLAPGEPPIIAELACALAYSGDVRAARELVEVLNRMSERFYVSDFLMAMTDIALDRTDEFFERLERSLCNRDVWLVWIDVLPKLKPLRNDPRFTSFVTRVRRA